jgi:hypothetical protein
VCVCIFATELYMFKRVKDNLSLEVNWVSKLRADSKAMKFSI